MENLQVGDKMPAFILKDQHGNNFDSSAFAGKQQLVVYFYPKDESPVCTKEACAFRDSFAEFEDAGALVIGINSGSVESHAAFAKKHRLPFTLLSDPGDKVLKQFGIKGVMFLTGRETFIIGKDGKIAFKYRAFLNGSAHSEKMLEFLHAH